MPRPAYNMPAKVILITLAILLLHGWASAQSSANLRASAPIIDQFPTVEISLSLTDANGMHVPDLDPNNFLVLEDGNPIHGAVIEERLVGTRQIFVINTTRSLRARDAFGLTRFDYVRQSLLEWWSQSEPSAIGLDDLSLITLERPLVVHSSMAAELAAALQSFEPEFRDEPSKFDLLLQAMDYTADPAPRLGMPIHMFFITSLILRPEEIPLAETIAKAKERGITIFPILVGPEELLEYAEVEDIRLLGTETGGEMIFYDSENGLSFLADRMVSQRTQYNLTYTSRANTSGTHSIQIQVTEANIDVLSNQQSFTLEIAPPQVTLLQPPEKIARQTEDPSLPLEAFPPLSQELKSFVTYPDGHPRTIVSSRLLVDGEIVDENLAPPFDRFEWDLQAYVVSGSHVLQVIVEDSLNLEGKSEQVQVIIEVIEPPRGLSALDPALGTILVIAGALAVGSMLSVVLFSIVRQRDSPRTSFQRVGRSKQKNKQRVSLRSKSDGFLAEAKLEAASPSAVSFLLVGTDIVLGRDGSLSAVHLDDPSLNGLHARLTRLANGDYLLRDQDSISGTWVNYSEVPKDGKVLHHGDMIHLGRVAYRFYFVNPPSPRDIRVALEKDQSEQKLREQ